MTDTTTGTTGTTTATTATTGTTATSTGTTGTTTATPSWYEGKIDAETIGMWQNKVGADLSDPVKVAQKLTEIYRGAEKLVGIRPDELVRFPKDASDEASWKNIYTRIGVPAEAKEYDLAGIKTADGKELDAAFADTMRGALHSAKVPKDRAPDVVKAVVKHMDAAEATRAADLTLQVNAEKQALDRNWGPNRDGNLFVAKSALEKLGTAAGLKPDQIQAGWDALSKVGGIGASYAMEMLRIAGSRMGEDKYVGGGGSHGGVLSQQQALDEINTLKQDRAFGERLFKGDAESKKKWTALHKIAYGDSSRAA